MLHFVAANALSHASYSRLSQRLRGGQKLVNWIITYGRAASQAVSSVTFHRGGLLHYQRSTYQVYGKKSDRISSSVLVLNRPSTSIPYSPVIILKIGADTIGPYELAVKTGSSTATICYCFFSVDIVIVVGSNISTVTSIHVTLIQVKF
jgi:hypothetical protein